jgi:hypothetical protein
MAEVTVDSYLAWGKLVKTWATGKSYFESDSPPITIDKLPIPRSIEELRDQMVLVGAEALLPPPNVVGLAIVQYTPDTMVVRLPPNARIKEMEEALAQLETSPYKFPVFYADFINRPLKPDEWKAVHACRIGDYTMSMCG